LFASNEPIKLDGGRAQQILQRRIHQSVAEYEVLNTLETSWGGLCTHVREGWNIGKPPYGYAAKRYRHPNPAKAAKGATKTRLEPDGARGETVTQIALWRYHECIGYGSIVDRLNAEPDRFPVSEPPGGVRARGAWSRSTVCDILRNPKYTGFQVFNRRATHSTTPGDSRRGAQNNPDLWVWSPEPVHEPLIPKWMFAELAERRGSRDRVKSQDLRATRTFVMRGMILCGCGRRRIGNVRPTRTYYTCWPKANNRGRRDTYAGHPECVYLREDLVLEEVSAFLADRVFGPHRGGLFAAGLASVGGLYGLRCIGHRAWSASFWCCGENGWCWRVLNGRFAEWPFSAGDVEVYGGTVRCVLGVCCAAVRGGDDGYQGESEP
jgi:site-specific DNA recombinase